jgi:hypothetical protein
MFHTNNFEKGDCQQIFFASIVIVMLSSTLVLLEARDVCLHSIFCYCNQLLSIGQTLFHKDL